MTVRARFFPSSATAHAAAAVAVIIVLLGPPEAATAQAPTVAVEVESCGAMPELATWLPILAAELTDTGVEVRADDGTIPTTRVHVTLRCEGDPEAALTATDVATEKQVHRTIALGDVPARLLGRTLALSVAELLRATWAELAVRAPEPDDTADEVHLRAATLARIDTVQPPADEPAAEPDEPAAASAPTPSIESALRIAASGQFFERFASGMGGASVGLAVGLGEQPWVATADVGAEASAVDVPRGSVALVHPFAALALSLRASFGPLAITAGAFVRGGPLLAIPVLDASARTVVLGAVVAGGRLGARVPVGAGWSLALELDVGGPLLSAQVFAAAEPAGGIDGLCLGARLIALGDL